jgi:hypothetical protein
VSKPRPKYWELNNLNLKAYGKPPREEPEGGFAEEERPAGFEEVHGWFREAAAPLKPRHTGRPADEPVAKIARLVGEYYQLWNRPRDPIAEEKVARAVHELQRAATKLEQTLPPVLNLLDDPADPSVTPLSDLWKALVLVKPHIGPPGKSGKPKPTWHFWAEELEQPIREALASTGREEISIKHDGPLARILHRALAEIDGERARAPEAVATFLKRRPKRGGAIFFF